MALVAAALLDLDPGRALDRASVALSLWGEVGESRAAGNLRETLRRTRLWEERAGLKLFQSAEHMLTRDSGTVTSDVLLFQSLDEPQTAAELRWLLELYVGDLLADLDPVPESLESWLYSKRLTLRDRFVTLALAGARSVGGEIGERALQRAQEEAPYDEAILRERMIASASSNSTPGPRTLFNRYAARLKQDLNVDPEQATKQLLVELEPHAYPVISLASMKHRHGVPASVVNIPKILILPPPQRAPLPTAEAVLVDTMIDEVTFALCRARTFAVFAPYTARQLAVAPFPQANPYGADYIVRTDLSAATEGDLHLKVSLTSLSTHEVLLSEQLAVSRADLNTRHVQLAMSLGPRLASGVERAERRYYRTTGSASAYVHFLLGSDDIKVLELRSLRRAKGHYRQAMKLSPSFVPARAMLARTLCLEWLLLDRKDPEPIREALRFARESIDIDPSDPLAQREVGHSLLYLDQLDEGLEALRTAADLGPHHADILLNYADGLVHIGEHPEARRIMDRAMALNPLPPDQYHWIAGTADYMLGDYTAASRAFARMKEREAASRFIAAVEAMNGNIEEAHRQRDIFMASHPEFRLADYMVPQRRPEDREHYLEGLHRAGFC